MKKIISYICILAAFVAVSCNRIESPEFPGANGDLSFVMLTSDMVTRATESGDDNYNENTIETIDWFFFSDAAGQTIIKEGRLGTTGTALSQATLSFDTSVAEYAVLKKKFFAYFLINYPGSVAHNGSLKLSDILALPITATNFEASPMPVFVMDSYEKAEGLIEMMPASNNEQRIQTVSLTRVAAKMVLNINVKKSVAGTGDEVWSPEIYTSENDPQLQAYFVNALITTTVAATPAERDEEFSAANNKFNDKAKYLTYSTLHPWVKNGETTDVVKISTTPFYTYPQAFARSDNGEPYFKIFLPWTSTKKGTNNFYYKVLVPGLDQLERNRFYHVDLNLDVIGGTTDDYVLATSQYLVAEWFSPGEMGQTGISSARFLDVPQDEYKFYNKDEMTIPVTSSHPIEATVTSASYYDFKNNRSVSLGTNSYSIVSTGKNSFTITHELERAIAESDFDCSPITFQVSIIHDDNGQQSPETVTVIQYPPIYIEQETSNGRVFINGTGNQQSNSTNCTNVNGDDLGGLVARNTITDTPNTNTNPRQYTVYVSVLPEGNTSVIGDPRGPKGGVSNLGNTVSNNYRPAGNDTQNIIAPAFKMASSYGKTSDLVFARAQERCAAYQENGYPAGRWRVPTVAEIEFVISLSEYEHIPQLYDVGRAGGTWAWSNSNRRYWCYWAGGMYAYGGVAYKNDSASDGGAGVAEPLTSSNLYDNSNARYRKNLRNRYYYYVNAVRCVYDVWYWGNDQDSSHMTSWGGYQTD